MNEASVYLSYRRSFSYYLTLALFHALRAQGIDVFMDTSIHDSRSAVHLGQIEARSHFLMVIAPGLIDVMQRADDPMRRELEHAVERRGIVPLLTNDFSFGGVFLPRELDALRRYYALLLTPETLGDTVAALMERFQQQIFGTITPTPPEQQEAAQRMIDEAIRQPIPSADELDSEIIFSQAHTRSRQDYIGKLAIYEQVLRLNPTHLYARFDRAVARRRSGDEAGAVADYDQVLRQSPSFYKAFNNRAELYFAQGHYEDALSDYEQATALRPTYRMSLAGKAITLHALGQTDEAIRLWRDLLALDERYYDADWVGRELRLPASMIDETQRLTLSLRALPHATDN